MYTINAENYPISAKEKKWWPTFNWWETIVVKVNVIQRPTFTAGANSDELQTACSIEHAYGLAYL